MEWTPEADATLRELNALGKSQKEIAEALGDCIQPRVSRRLKQLGILAARPQKFAAANTETRERLAAARATFAEAILNDAIELRQRLWEEYTYYASGPNGPELVTLDVPDAKAVADFTTAVNKLVSTLENLTRMGAGKSVDNAKSVLTQVQNDLAKFADQYENNDADDEADT